MRLKFLRKQPEAGDAWSFYFDPQGLSWQAGQFITYRLPHSPADDRGEKRFFTNAAAPFEGEIRITTRLSERSSSFKQMLSKLKPGDVIEALAATGNFTLRDPQGAHVFIAGGIGITPFRAILKQLDHQGRMPAITLLYANRTDEFVFKDELDELSRRHPELKIHYYAGAARINEAAIAQASPDLQHPTYWVSGPKPMVESLEATLKAMGVRTEHLKTDYFPGYGWPDH